jgi:hypothetical protein
MTQVSVDERPDLISGLFKFDLSSTIPKERIAVVLTSLASDWARKDSNWQRLYVRECSKTQYGIGFEYALAGPDYEASQRQLLDRMTEKLRRQFGDHFVEWDMGRPTWIIRSHVVE